MKELNVKVGDKVIVYLYAFRSSKKVLGKAVKISPTGQITVEYNGYKNRFNKYGIMIGCTRYSPFIKEWSEEEEQEIFREDIIEDAMDIIKNIEELTYEQATEILKIFGENMC